MTAPILTRRSFNRAVLVPALAAIAAIAHDGNAAARQGPASKESTKETTRRELVKQRLRGDPPRELTLTEVTYPPGTGSPPHVHPHGVMAFVVAGSVVSKVGDQPERIFRAGEAWWEPHGATHRVSRNASASEPAKLLAIYIAPAGATAEELMKPI